MYSAASRRVTCTYTIMNERTVMTAGEQQLYHSLSVHTSSHTIVVKSSLVPLVQLFIAYRKRGLHTRLKKTPSISSRPGSFTASNEELSMGVAETRLV